MMRSVSSHRRGLGILWSVAVLAVLTALMAAVTWQMVASRRWMDRRTHQIQTEWLARSGVELAADRLLTDPTGYQGEKLEPIPGALLHITVRHDDNVYRITSEARYPAEGPELVTRTVTRQLRRTAENDRIRLEVMP